MIVNTDITTEAQAQYWLSHDDRSDEEMSTVNYTRLFCCELRVFYIAVIFRCVYSGLLFSVNRKSH